MKRFLLIIMFFSLFLSPLAGQEPAEELFREAESRFRNKNYELALDRYDALIRQYPLSDYVPDAQFRKAVCLYRLDRIEESLTLFKRVESRFRSSRFINFVPFWKGVLYYTMDRFAEAVPELTLFLDAEEATELDDQAFLYKSLSELELGNPQAAISSLERLLEGKARPEEQSYALSLLLSLYSKQGLHEKVVDLYESISVGNVEEEFVDTVRLSAAEAYWAKKEREKADSLYRELTDAVPDIAAIAFSRRYIIIQESGADEELNSLLNKAEQVLAGETGHLKVFWQQVALNSYRNERFAFAELYMSRVWDLRRSEEIEGLIPLYYAELLKRRGENERAISILNEYLDFGEGHRDRVLLELADLQVKAGSLEDAKQSLSLFYQEHQDSRYFAQGLYRYALVLNKTGSPARAVRLIDDLFAEGRSSGYTAELLRLKASSVRKLERYREASATLHEYLALRQDDVAARIEYAKLLFLQERYQAVLDEIDYIRNNTVDFERLYPEKELELFYLSGLSKITQRKYQPALEDLGSLLRSLESRRTENGLSEDMERIYPYALFYRGWTLYKLSRYTEAVTVFETFLRRNPRHELSQRAHYLAGWNAFNAGNMGEAEDFLRTFPENGEAGELELKVRFLLAKTLVNLGRYREALDEFSELKDRGESEYSVQAAYEYAQVLSRMDRIVEAGEAYKELFKQHRDHPLGEKALYDRAELFYGAGMYEKAREAFSDYRLEFPNGEQFDAALFWGGNAAARLGQDTGAVLLWELLIDKNRNSTYRPEAMNRTARYYVEREEFRKALNLYTELIAGYPEQAAEIAAERKANELRYLLLGLSKREAELWVTIDSEGGPNSDRGRQAIIELGRLYILKGEEQSVNRALLAEKLRAVSEKRETDPAAASQATYLLGEYYADSSENNRAANTFLEAATINPDDESLISLSLYRAMEMMKKTGRTEDAERLLDRLEENFPDSQWTEQGRELLEGGGS